MTNVKTLGSKIAEFSLYTLLIFAILILINWGNRQMAARAGTPTATAVYKSTPTTTDSRNS
ncbi:MAG: hypothetical protein JO301_12255 [Chitinophagaceae bacterium]|nr:hypothetical protein [Chitinophagaceae bacterium]